MPVITDDQFTLLNYIGKEGKTVEQICDYQPLGLFWDSKTFNRVLTELEWSNLIDEENRFVTLNKFGQAAIKKYKWRKFRKDLEEFPKVYWLIIAIVSYGIGLATPTIINILRLDNQAQTKTEPSKQSSSTAKQLSDSTLHK